MQREQVRQLQGELEELLKISLERGVHRKLRCCGEWEQWDFRGRLLRVADFRQNVKPGCAVLVSEALPRRSTAELSREPNKIHQFYDTLPVLRTALQRTEERAARHVELAEVARSRSNLPLRSRHPCSGKALQGAKPRMAEIYADRNGRS